MQYYTLHRIIRQYNAVQNSASAPRACASGQNNAVRENTMRRKRVRYMLARYIAVEDNITIQSQSLLLLLQMQLVTCSL